VSGTVFRKRAEIGDTSLTFKPTLMNLILNSINGHI